MKKLYKILLSVFTICMLYTMPVHAYYMEITEENFDHIWYADQYPDLKSAYGYDRELLYYNYVTAGKAEGRKARPALDAIISEANFNVGQYAEDNPDVVAAYGNDAEALWNHYINVGITENREAYFAWFDAAMWIKTYEIVDSITDPSMGDREKVKAVHDWLRRNVAYDLDSYLSGQFGSASYSMEGAILHGKSVCQGYAEAFQWMMELCGIECDLVSGQADGYDGWGSHAWNQVKIDGKWYNIDVTWDDPVPDSGYGVVYSYEYFLISNAELNKDHKAKGPVHDC